MKRRTFLLGGGALATVSLGATATNATIQNAVSAAADFRAVEPISDPLVYVVNDDVRLYNSDADTETSVQQTDNPGVIGDGGNVVGGSNPDVPYVTQKAELYATELEGSTDELLYAGKTKGSGVNPKKQTSRLAIGDLSDWNSPPFSGNVNNIVLTADKNSADILAIDPNGNPNNPSATTETITSPSNGCGGVVGVTDFDDDGSVEIVFVGSSQQLRYLEQDGTTTKKISNGGVGTNSGLGVGHPVDFGRGKVEVPFVDGSNNAALVDADGNKTTLATSVAAKAPVAPADVNDDTELEYVFIDTNGEVGYIEDIGNSNTVNTLLVEGSTVTPDQGPGLAAGESL